MNQFSLKCGSERAIPNGCTQSGIEGYSTARKEALPERSEIRAGRVEEEHLVYHHADP